MAQGQVRLDADVQALVRWLREQEAKRGNHGMSEKAALNFLAREGARSLQAAASDAKKAAKR